MFFGILIALISSSPFSAADEWPTIRDVYVGDTFLYPLLGVRGHEMRPTQFAVGMRSVAEKAEKLRGLGSKALKRELKSEPIPVVAAPDGHFYIIDHHHQALAAHRVGRENAYFYLESDLSKVVDMDEFWVRMKKHKWVRDLDHRGRPIQIPRDLPKSILGLADDVYRSLAAFVRKSGGFLKTSTPFAEFAWADYFRTRVKVGRTAEEFRVATVIAEDLAHRSEARSLPGWVAVSTQCRDFLRPEPKIGTNP